MFENNQKSLIRAKIYIKTFLMKIQMRLFGRFPNTVFSMLSFEKVILDLFPLIILAGR